MAVCKICNREMSGEGGADSCLDHPITLLEPGRRRRTMNRLRYGEEADDWGAQSGRRCHDCNVKPGGYHHLGCDVERCPHCGEQFIGCGCDFD